MADQPSPATDWASLASALVDLPAAVVRARRGLDLSQRAAAGQIGVDPKTLRRLEVVGGCQLDTAVAVCRWLAGTTAEPQRPAGHSLLVQQLRVQLADRAIEYVDAPDGHEDLPGIYAEMRHIRRQLAAAEEPGEDAT